MTSFTRVVSLEANVIHHFVSRFLFWKNTTMTTNIITTTKLTNATTNGKIANAEYIFVYS